MLCQFQVYSKLIQLYVYIYPFFFRFFSHVGYYRLLSRVPCAVQQVLVADLFLNIFTLGKRNFSVFCCHDFCLGGFFTMSHNTCIISQLKIVSFCTILLEYLKVYIIVVVDRLLSHRRPCPSASPGICSDSCPLSQRCHPAVSPSAALSPVAFSLSQHQGLFQRVGSQHHVASVLELQHQLVSFRIDWVDLAVRYCLCFLYPVSLCKLLSGFLQGKV